VQLEVLLWDWKPFGGCRRGEQLGCAESSRARPSSQGGAGTWHGELLQPLLLRHAERVFGTLLPGQRPAWFLCWGSLQGQSWGWRRLQLEAAALTAASASARCPPGASGCLLATCVAFSCSEQAVA